MIPAPEFMPAVITPFGQRGEIDVKAHTSNMRVLAALGIEGYVIGGSNGEGPYLEPGERARLVKAGRRRKSHFMVGIAAESTRTALAQVAEASEAGADSLLVLTPTTLARNNDEAILRFYRTVADRSKTPVFLYSVPPVSAYSLPVELIWRLSRHENIIGMKDSSGDVVRLLHSLLGVISSSDRRYGNRMPRSDHRQRELRPDPGAGNSGGGQR